MTIADIPLLSLEILKHNIPNYDTLTDDQILEYFNNKYDVFSLPQLPDEEKGLAILKDTIIKDELIIVCSDYDCDGLSGAAIGYKALKHKCNNYKVIHNKRVNGNGFTKPFMDVIKKLHAKTPISLLISVDHGSNNVEAVDEMHAIGIKNVIITDHHSISGEGVVNADAFITPQRGCPELLGMCGAYVLFKLLSGLYRDDKDIFNKLYRPCLPHVAIATVADVMSLSLDYNRLVVRAGLQLINADTGLWKMLGEKLNIPEVFSYKDIGYVISPFINTGNRSSEEELFYHILIEEDPGMLSSLINSGVSLNKARKAVKRNVMVGLANTLDVHNISNSISLIVDTDMAINGVIAGSLGDMHQVPVTCFTVSSNDKVLSGSSRGILEHVNIVEAYRSMAKIDPNLFVNYGGHPGAGGCGIHLDKFDRFKELFDKVISEFPKPKLVKKETPVINFNTKYLDYGIVEAINYAGPVGKDWPIILLQGRFKLKAVFSTGMLAILSLVAANGRHLKGTYFYKDTDPSDDVHNWMPIGKIVTLKFEPQYYRRYSRVSLTLLIDTIMEI